MTANFIKSPRRPTWLAWYSLVLPEPDGKSWKRRHGINPKILSPCNKGFIENGGKGKETGGKKKKQSPHGKTKDGQKVTNMCVGSLAGPVRVAQIPSKQTALSASCAWSSSEPYCPKKNTASKGHISYVSPSSPRCPSVTLLTTLGSDLGHRCSP